MISTNTPPHTPVNEVLSFVKKALKVEDNHDEYVVFFKNKFDLTQTLTFSQLGVTSSPSDIIYFIKKDIYNTFESNLNKVSKALLDEAQKLDEGKQHILNSIKNIRGHIEDYYEGDAMDCIYDVLPYDILTHETEDENLAEITKWFKEKYFTFIHSPKCGVCGKETQQLGLVPMTLYESEGKCSRVEAFKCGSCGAVTRFPRYNDVRRLTETRCGRCGEFANLFTAMLLALGFDARIVVDLTDHVWSEVWLESKGRYVHVDPCEDIIDAPFTYESGWGKKLEWCFAVGRNCAKDVTPRYTRDVGRCVARRAKYAPEEWVAKALAMRDAQYKAGMDAAELEALRRREEMDAASMRAQRDENKPEEERPRISGDGKM